MMISYKLCVSRFDGAVISVVKTDTISGQQWAIPFDPANTDYQQYLKWLEEGNQPLPADEEPK